VASAEAVVATLLVNDYNPEPSELRQQWSAGRAHRGMSGCRRAGIGHHPLVYELTDLTGRWWDWRVGLWDSSTLRFIADNDLTHHHSVEVSFTDVAWVATADTCTKPTFRPATPGEHDFARGSLMTQGPSFTPGTPRHPPTLRR
jgi:hypothetical protein